jgi:3'(2'), 5'-bisphosphate nucleotidase
VSSASLLESVNALARAAGEAILSVYRRADFGVAYKDDRSPVTDADLAAHRILSAGLSVLPSRLPVLSEESAQQMPLAERLSWSRYWLVDPLDGTREFLKRNDEFTVNIALVDDGEPVLGVVYAPALDELACAARGEGAWLEINGRRSELRARRVPAAPVFAISRSHAGSATMAILDRIGAHETLAAGSALKFIRLAQGRADVYPRLGPTSEWDTAAGQCVLEEAGGGIFDLSGQRLSYNRRASLLNPDFVAVGDRDADWPRRVAALLPKDGA